MLHAIECTRQCSIDRTIPVVDPRSFVPACVLDIPRVCPTTHIHVSECDEEELQRSPIDGDIRRTKPNSSVATIQPFLNVLIEALRDQRRAARQQREIEECRSSSDAGGYCSCCRTDLLQEHLRRLLAELSEARAGGRKANEGNGRAEPRKRAREQVVRQPKQCSARVHFSANKVYRGVTCALMA
eukprot:scaffold39571_cov70-Phaeocystis_antarctica.AAC.5